MAALSCIVPRVAAVAEMRISVVWEEEGGEGGGREGWSELSCVWLCFLGSGLLNCAKSAQR